MKWTRKHFVIAGVALIAATNAVALLGVAYNRSGAPESTLKLTERELRPSWFDGRRENSGLGMQLKWRVLPAAPTSAWTYRYGGEGGQVPAAFLDAAKMAEFGFDTARPDRVRHPTKDPGRELSRGALLVLEFDGLAYQKSLAGVAVEVERLLKLNNAESTKLAEEIPIMEAKANSRLFVVDAGRDAAALRAKYPDRTKYAIVHGQVRPVGGYQAPAQRHFGYVSGVDAATINVPLEFRPAFAGADQSHDYSLADIAKRARYEAAIAFGQRFEPWLTAATKK